MTNQPILVRSPYRISLFGGSCDISEYFSKHQALLIGFAVGHYSYILLRKTPYILPYHTLVQCHDIERVQSNDLIKHNVVRSVLEYMDMKDGVEIFHFCGWPSRTGSGSSSAFAASLINAVHQFQYDKPVPKYELIDRVNYLERQKMAEPGGLQDAAWTSTGGVNSMRIDTTGKITIRPLPVCDDFLKKFHASLVLFYVGQRNSFGIAESHINNKNAEPFKICIQQIAEEALKAFEKEDIEEIGKLLD